MPPDMGESLPSWLRHGSDDDPIATENPPEGKITEEQVRAYFKEIGVPDAEVEKLISASGRTHEGGEAKDPLGESPITDRSKAESQLDTLENRDETTMPKPMFRGDRMGQ